MKFSPDLLVQHLHALAATPPRYWVALSGGLDSTVLLNALVLRRDDLRAPLAAVHIDHALHADSPQWAERCRVLCERLDVPMERFGVIVDAVPGASVEAAARDARYEVFRELLDKGEALLTAQHQDDQLETFLLQALRGAGPHGLAAMPERSRLGNGWLLRPLLGWPRAALEDWAREQGLEWLDDPSNSDERFDRNYLRRQIIPRLKVRWPAAAQTVSRSARHCAETAALADELAAMDLSACDGEDDVLPLAGLRNLDAARQRNLLRHWFEWRGLPRPSEKKLEHMLLDVVPARPDAQPCVEWADVALRRYRDALYVEHTFALPHGGNWQGGNFALGEGWGELRRAAADRGLPEGRVEIRFRQGGETLRPAGSAHHRELKKLLQESGVLPWRRDALPLVYVDDELAAVADLWLNDDLLVPGGWRVAWRGRPRILEKKS